VKLKDALQAHGKDQKTKVPTQQVKFYRKKKIVIARQQRDYPTPALLPKIRYRRETLGGVLI